MAPLTFFDIPLEVRHKVYSHALESREMLLRTVGSYWEGSKRIVEPRVTVEMVKYPALLRVNHQVCAEIESILLADIALRFHLYEYKCITLDPAEVDLDRTYVVGSLNHCFGSETKKPLVKIQHLTIDMAFASRSDWYHEHFCALKSVTFDGWRSSGSLHHHTSDKTDKAGEGKNWAEHTFHYLSTEDKLLHDTIYGDRSFKVYLKAEGPDGVFSWRKDYNVVLVEVQTDGSFEIKFLKDKDTLWSFGPVAKSDFDEQGVLRQVRKS